jgi:CubicO group peptidase (beta-lactamase class C family)
MTNTQQQVADHYAETRAEAPPEMRALMKGFPPLPEDRVDWHNMMQPPYNRWSFRNIERLRPTLSIYRGGNQATTLEQGDRPLEDFDFVSVSGEKISLDLHLQASFTDAFIVLKDGAIAYEKYFNGQTADLRHIVFSVTKSIVGTLAEKLVFEKALNPQALVGDYVPSLAASAFGDATVRQLMDMAVGIHYSEAYDDPMSEVAQFASACGFQPPVPGTKAHESTYAFLATLNKKGAHGGLFDYVTAVTETLGWVMEVAAQKSSAELIEQVWKELGCERDSYILVDPLGKPVTGAGFNATARDLSKFGLMMLNRGRVNGKQVVPAEVVAEIAGGGDPEIYAKNAEFSELTPGASYKSQWYVFQEPTHAIMAIGVCGQYIYIDFDANLVVVKQSSLPSAVHIIDADTVRLMRALGASYV